MSNAKKRLIKMMNEVPESDLDRVLDYVEYIKDRKEKKIFTDFITTNERGFDFWLSDKALNSVVH